MARNTFRKVSAQTARSYFLERETLMTTFNSIEEFRAAAQGKSEPEYGDAKILASFDTEVKAGDADRTLTFVISTASVDRVGDTIDVSGWKLDAFRKNPVVLWAHDASSLPVAKADKVWIEGGKLMAQAEFTPAGMARFNDTVFEMLKAGFLNATSVGFSPLKYAFTDDPQRRFGIDFLEQELLEFSVVPVPANAEALIQGRAAGIDVAPVAEWCEAALKRLGKAVITTERLTAIERAATNARLATKRNRELDLIRVRSR
jgi:HK97 family phage prohead protease